MHHCINDIMEPSDKSSSLSISRHRIIGYTCLLGSIILFSYIICSQQQSRSLTTILLDVWYTSQEKTLRPLHYNRDHGSCGSCPSDKQVSNAWELGDIVSLLSPKNPFLVNIGAASAVGGIYDPTYPLLTSHDPSFGALLVDSDSNPAFFYAYPNRSDIRVVHDFIWTETVIENIFEKYNVPKQFTLLKVDVDSYECSLLEKILSSNYRPQIIHTEFNPVFPPPVVFMPIYNATTKNDWKPQLWANGGPFYGCSLTALSNIMKLYDYVLVEVEFWDAIYIERRLAAMYHIQVPANDTVAYEYGFVNHSCLPYCRGNAKLYNIRIDKAIKLAMNQSDFIAHIRPLMDTFAPVSVKNNERHPYIISL